MRLRRPSALVRSLWLLGAMTLLLAGCNRGGGASSAASPRKVNLLAGVNDPEDKNIAALMLMPQNVDVKVGTTVTWHFNGPEPHTVTFVPQGQPTPAPSSPGATEAKGTPGPYDGTTLVSSGLLPTGNTTGAFALTFTKAGTYDYVCVIHPGQKGRITVGSTGESQKTIRERAKAERDKWILEGRDAKKTFLEKPVKTVKNSNGSTTYYVEMGTQTEHTAVLAFQPVNAKIKPGDRVVFVNNSTVPHTASFAGGGVLPQNPESPEAMRASGPSPQTLNATAVFNTGWLPPKVPSGPPEAARSFTFIVPAAGTYGYVCLLHATSGHAGSIVAS